MNKFWVSLPGIHSKNTTLIVCRGRLWGSPNFSRSFQCVSLTLDSFTSRSNLPVKKLIPRACMDQKTLHSGKSFYDLLWCSIIHCDISHSWHPQFPNWSLTISNVVAGCLGGCGGEGQISTGLWSQSRGSVRRGCERDKHLVVAAATPFKERRCTNPHHTQNHHHIETQPSVD